MRNPKVMTVQMKIALNKLKTNLDKIKHFCTIAYKHNCDFIVFPEYSSGITSIEEWSEIKHSKYVNTLKDLAKKFQINIISGSTIFKSKDIYLNRAFFFSKQGEIKGIHDKIALTKYDEISMLKPGKEINVIDTEFGKIGLVICRDMIYPEIINQSAKKGAKIIFIPSFWNQTSTKYEIENKHHNIDYPLDAEIKTLKTIPLARAIENEVFVIIANAAESISWKEGSVQHTEILAGHSSINAPIYGTLDSLPHNKEGFLVTTLNLNYLDHSKKTYAIIKLKPDLSWINYHK